MSAVKRLGYTLRDIFAIASFAVKVIGLKIAVAVSGRNAAIVLFVSGNKRCITRHASSTLLGSCISINHRFYKPRFGANAREIVKASPINRFAGRVCSVLLRLFDPARTAVFVWGYADIEIFGEPIETTIPIYRLEDPLFGYRATENQRLFGYLIEKDTMYFDGRQETAIERLLQSHRAGTWEETSVGRDFIEFYRNSELKKFGQINEPLTLDISADDIVIVGQCVGDMAWLATPTTVADNVELVAKAINESRIDGKFYYKPHPFNRFNAAELPVIRREFPNCRIIEGKVSFPQVVRTGALICVNTSGAGLEAAVRGSRVKTYGVSFYSGWGFTEDALPVERRTNRLTAEDVFYAFTFEYTHFADRQTLKTVSAEQMFGALRDRYGSGSKASRSGQEAVDVAGKRN